MTEAKKCSKCNLNPITGNNLCYKCLIEKEIEWIQQSNEAVKNNIKNNLCENCESYIPSYNIEKCPTCKLWPYRHRKHSEEIVAMLFPGELNKFIYDFSRRYQVSLEDIKELLTRYLSILHYTEWNKGI